VLPVVYRREFTVYASKAVDRLMRSIVQTSNAIQANKWLAGARLIYDAVKSKRAALGLNTKPFASWAGLDLDVQQIVAGQLVTIMLTFIIIIIIIKGQFIRRSNMAKVTTRSPYNVRCSYSGNS